VREKHARGDDLLQAEAAAGEHALQVLHDLARLGLDSLWIGGGVGDAGERHLARDEDPAVDLDGMAERRHRVRRPLDHVEDRQVHRCILGKFGDGARTNWGSVPEFLLHNPR